MTRPIDENRAGFSNGRQPNCHGISVADGCTLQTRSAFNAVGLVEQLADGDLGFVRVAFPFSDRVGDGVVQLEQAITYRRECGDSPKTLCSAEDRPPAASRSAIGIVLKNGAPALHDKHGDTALALRIFCGARTISGLYFRRC